MRLTRPKICTVNVTACNHSIGRHKKMKTKSLLSIELTWTKERGIAVIWYFKTMEQDFLKATIGSRRRVASEGLSKYPSSRACLTSINAQLTTRNDHLWFFSSSRARISASCFNRNPKSYQMGVLHQLKALIKTNLYYVPARCIDSSEGYLFLKGLHVVLIV